MVDMTGESRYTYDGLGRYTSVTDGAGERTEYRCDNAANQPISAVEFDGKHYTDIRYHYDEDGNLIEEERGKNGNLKVEKTYTY